MKLSKAQQETLDKMDIGQDYTAYDLQCYFGRIGYDHKKQDRLEKYAHSLLAKLELPIGSMQN